MRTSELLQLLPNLEDQDVYPLYDIVCLAQRSGSRRPIKALHDAYDEIFPPSSAEPEHDNKCFRFLSHAARWLSKDGTEGLVKRFRALLHKLDIYIILGDDEGHVSDNAADEAQDHAFQSVKARPNRRRASFNDSNLDTTWISGRDLAVDGRAGQEDRRHDSRLGIHKTHRRVRSASNEHLRYQQLPQLEPEPTRDRDKITSRDLEREADRFLLTSITRRCLWQWSAKTRQLRRRQRDLMQLAMNHDRRTLLRQAFVEMREGVLSNRFEKQQERRAARARNLFLMTKAFSHWAQVASDQVVRTSVATRHMLRLRYFSAWRNLTIDNELKCRGLLLRKWMLRWHAQATIRSSQRQQAEDFHQSHLLRRSCWTWFFALCERNVPMWRDHKLLSRHFHILVRRRAADESSDLAAQGRHNTRLMARSITSLTVRLQAAQDLDSIAVSRRIANSKLTYLRWWRRKTNFKPSEVRAVAAKDTRLKVKSFAVWRQATALSRRGSSVDQHRILTAALSAWNDRLRIRTLQIKINDRVVLQAIYKWVLEERYLLFSRVMEQRLKVKAAHAIGARSAARTFQLEEANQIFRHRDAKRRVQHVMVRLHGSVRQREQDELTAIEFRNARVLPRCLSRWKEESSQTLKLTRWAASARFYCLTTMAIRRWKEAMVRSQKIKRREAFAAVRRRKKADLALRCLRALGQEASRISSLRSRTDSRLEAQRRASAQSYLYKWQTKAIQWRIDEREADNMFFHYRRELAVSMMIERLSALKGLHDRAEAFETVRQERLASNNFRKLSDAVFLLRRSSDTAEAWRDRKFTQHRREMLRYWSIKAGERRIATSGPDPDSPSKTPTIRAIRNRRTINSTIDTANTSLAQTDLLPTAEDVSGLDASAFTVGTTPIPGYLRTPARRTARTRARYQSIPSQAADPAAAAGARGAEPFGSSVLGSTTPAPYRPGAQEGMEVLTPQVTPFGRKLRQGGYPSLTPGTAPRSVFLGSAAGGRKARFSTIEED